MMYRMPGTIDRERVRSSFGRGASAYDRQAVVQKRVLQQALDLLQAEKVQPGAVLDIGCGTGLLLESLAERYPHASLAGVDLAEGMVEAARQRLGERAEVAGADAESLPFADGTFDLIVSTSAFQWLDSLERVFAGARRVLRPGGLFLFSLFGEGTLQELRDSYRSALEKRGKSCLDRTHRFFSCSAVAAALETAGFAEASASCRSEREFHPDVPHLLRSLRAIGAANASPFVSAGLGERRVMLDMMEMYAANHGSAEGIPATYGVIWGKGRKG